MWQLLFVFLCLCTAHVYADEDLFTDAQSEIPIEFDANFKDDFTEIESLSAIDKNSNLMIVDTYGLWHERGLLRREQSISLLGGGETVASAFHLLLYPQLHVNVPSWILHFGIPLRFPVYDYVGLKRHIRQNGFVRAEKFIAPRQQDFRSFADVQKLFRHIEYGSPVAPHFMQISRQNAVTLGHGDLIKNMASEGLYDEDYAFVSAHAHFEHAHMSGMIGPLFKAHMLGLNARFAPLHTLDVHPFVRTINVDVTYAADWLAPNLAKREEPDFVLSEDRRHVLREEGSAQGFSIATANEITLTPWLALKPYVTWSNLWLSNLHGIEAEPQNTYGTGMHLGHDASFYIVPGVRSSVLLFKSEARLFSSRYLPSYFDSTYMLDRRIINEPSNNYYGSTPITKSQLLSQHLDSRGRFGYLFQLAFAQEKLLHATLSYENARSFADGRSLPALRKIHFLFGFTGLDIVRGHVGYQATAIEELDDLFDFEKSRALLSIRGQLKLMSFLYFDTWLKHSFGINDMFSVAQEKYGKPTWFSNEAETRAFNFGVGLEFAMAF